MGTKTATKTPAYVLILAAIFVGLLLSTVGFLYWLLFFAITPASWNLLVFTALLWLSMFSGVFFILGFLFSLDTPRPPEVEPHRPAASFTDLIQPIGFTVLVIVTALLFGPLGIVLTLILFIALNSQPQLSSTEKDRIHQVINQHHRDPVIPYMVFVLETGFDPQTISTLLSSMLLHHELTGSLDQDGYHPKSS
jgi:hypothetical protein